MEMSNKKIAAHKRLQILKQASCVRPQLPPSVTEIDWNLGSVGVSSMHSVKGSEKPLHVPKQCVPPSTVMPPFAGQMPKLPKWQIEEFLVFIMLSSVAILTFACRHRNLWGVLPKRAYRFSWKGVNSKPFRPKTQRTTTSFFHTNF